MSTATATAAATGGKQKNLDRTCIEYLPLVGVSLFLATLYIGFAEWKATRDVAAIASSGRQCQAGGRSPTANVHFVRRIAIYSSENTDMAKFIGAIQQNGDLQKGVNK
jgi:hypothetical protein